METSTTLDPNLIPPLWGLGEPAKPEPIIKKPERLLDNAPNEVTLGGFFGKIVIGGIIGACIALLFFAILSAVGGILGSENGNPSAILGIMLAFIGFIAGMLGNMGLALLYNLFFSKRYYALGKMFGLIFTSSIVIFILTVPLYFLFQGNVGTAFTIFGVQIIFSFFITSNLIEFLAHPNYSASSMMGNLLGFMLSIVIYLGFVIKLPPDKIVDNLPLLMVLPPLLGYTIIIAGLGIWDAVYYKLFEWGNNPFYLRSLSELSKERQAEIQAAEKEGESVNVEVG